MDQGAPQPAAASGPTYTLPGGLVIKPYNPAGEVELGVIMGLMAKELSEPYSIFTYRYFLAQWPQFAYVAYAPDGQLIGAVVAKSEQRGGVERGYIAMLAVEAAYRGHGLGSKLVSACITKMAETCQLVCLETEITNTAALRLYEGLGFIRDKRLPKYYLNGNDAYRLKLWLV